ncbi:MAG: chemotaxis protein CheA [Promethearchaeota archaeon]|nr:MAG: chemotaxis protein CheA [Candidatus Lokiarchaeota archaeon]
MSISKDDIKLFISETEDLIQKVEDEIFKLEEDPNNSKPKQELYFAFHTLKGLTAMAGLDRASKFCHYFESLLDKSKETSIEEEKQETFMKLLFDSLDLLRSILKRVKGGDFTDIDEQFLDVIKESFDEFESETPIEVSMIQPIPPDQIEKFLADKTNLFYKIYIRLQPTCVFKKVRLFIIFRALNDVGQIFFSEPEPQLLEEGEFKIDFELYYVSQKSNAEILKIIDEILEIENKVITSMNNAEVKKFHEDVVSKWTAKAEKPKAVTPKAIAPKAKPTKKKESKVEVGDLASVSRVADSIRDERDKITSVKVDIGILEKLMNFFGELVIIKNHINQHLKEKGDQETNRIFDDMDKPFMEIQEIIFNLKLVRVESTFRKYRRLVRDVAKEVGKKAQLILEGTNVEIDRKILEEINSPLIHLLRNAIYHGLETPQERKRMKKDETGTLMLTTSRRAGLIHIEVIDDGQGINYDDIRKKVIEKEYYTAEEAEKLDDEELNRFILMPGFSTLSDADQISGRGMGMAIVAEKIKELGGNFTIRSEKNKGTRITLMVPFTRAILNAQLLKISGDLFAIPTENIKQIFLFNPASVEHVGQEQYYKLDSDLIPVIHLGDHLNFQDDGRSPSRIAIWIKKDEETSMMFVADEILQQMNVVVKPFKFNYSKFYDILGSTIMSDGSICLILDVLSIIDTALEENRFSKLSQIQQ